MSLPPLDVDADIERLIKKAQQSFGTIPSDEIDSRIPNSNAITDIYSGWMRTKMLQFKLIEKSDKEHLYVLTERGWLFESFAIEKKRFERERFLKNFAYWRARLWLLFVAVGFVAGLVAPMLAEKLKTMLQIQETKAQTKQPVKR